MFKWRCQGKRGGVRVKGQWRVILRERQLVEESKSGVGQWAEIVLEELVLRPLLQM